LPRLPRASWEGWFLIAIPRRPGPVRWTKTHLFRSRGGRRRAPLAAVEGLGRERELACWVGTSSGVSCFRHEPEPGELSADAGCFSLTVPGRLRFAGEPDRLAFSWREPDGAALDYELGRRTRVDWARAGDLLGYFGLLSTLRGRVRDAGARHEIGGLGVAEHAWGASVPLPRRALLGGHWHWDVLAFERTRGGDLPDGSALAALACDVPLLGQRCLGAGGAVEALPGERFGAFRVEVPGRRGRQAPRRWIGKLRGTAGELTYEAAASTPAAEPFPRGAFLGFDFEASYRTDGRRVTLHGSGFSEQGL
jgi:hypothetical protein